MKNELGYERRYSKPYNLNGVTAHVEIIEKVDLYRISLILTAESKEVYDVLFELAQYANDSATPIETNFSNYQIKMCLYADSNASSAMNKT